MTEKITSSEIRVLSSAFYSDSYSETPCISATYSRAFHPWRRTWEFLLPTTRQPTQPQTSRWSMRIWHDAVHDKLMSMTSWMISSQLKWPFLQQFANQKRNCAALPLFWKEYWLTQIFLQSSFNRPTPPPSTIILLIFSRWKVDMIYGSNVSWLFISEWSVFVFNRILIQNLSESSTSEPVEDFKGFKKTRDFGDFQVIIDVDLGSHIA